jgi:hypothetical protein
MRVMVHSRLFFYVRSMRVSCVQFVILLITRYMCEFDMIVYSVIIKYVFYPLVFVLLCFYLMSVNPLPDGPRSNRT